MSKLDIPPEAQRILEEIARKNMTPQERADEEKREQYREELYAALESKQVQYGATYNPFDRENKMLVQEGDIAWTPVEPYTRVKVIGIYHNNWSNRTIAIVEYLEDHLGHRAGSQGDYYIEDLTKDDEPN